VVNEEVLDKKRKPPLVLGAGHIAKDGGRLKTGNTANLIEKAHLGAMGIVFVFGTVPPFEYKAEVLKEMASLIIPSLVYPLQETSLGEELWLGRAPWAQVCDGLLYVGASGIQRMIRTPRGAIAIRFEA
jgi:hypothetical protein